MNLSAFKAYDVRGIYPTDVNEDLAGLVGDAFAKYTRQKLSKSDSDQLTFAVGGDMRTSTPSLKTALIKSLVDQNVKVLDIGMCTTPMLNFAVNSKQLHGGVMVSASHNPGEYNAFKIVGSNGVQLSSETGLEEISEIVKSQKSKVESKDGKKQETRNPSYAGSYGGQVRNKLNDSQRSNELSLELVPRSGETSNKKQNIGDVVSVDVLDEYIQHLVKLVKLKGTKKIVVDYGNGVGSISASHVLQKYNTSTVELYKEPNGNFPNHNADPHDLANFKDLQAAVKQKKADMGVFYDGDSDRAYFVSEKGNIVMADIAFCILADYELKNYNYENKTLYHDLRFTKAVKDIGIKNNANVVMMRVGNPFYKTALKEKGGVMAGELSGHIMYKNNYCIDDGLFATLKILEVLENSNESLQTLVDKYTKYATSDEMSFKLNSMEDADKAMQKVKQEFSDGESIELDGVYIQYKDWWFNLRKSGTEPKIRLRLEANNKKILEQKTQELLTVIQGFLE